MDASATYYGREIDYLEDLGSKLRNLKGYATLAHELLQNADDAPGVKKCFFDVREDALIVENDGRFSDCGALEEEECPWMAKSERGHRCDFHRFRKVAGGDKRREGNTTGAFGIGFISVYQITDRPEVISGRHWILDECEEPRRRIAQCEGCQVCQGVTEGTRFVLPWARDPDSPLRKSLRAQPVPTDVVGQLVEELESSLPAAMIFLKKIEKVEIRHEGRLIRCIERLPNEEGNQVLICGASDEGDEIWHLFRGSFDKEAAELRQEHGELIEEKRSSEVVIALRQHAIVTGLLCATLPTQQRTGLPFHINGDFFPSEDRKRVILEQDFQSDWNRAILKCAAEIFGDSLESIRGRCEAKHLWGLIDAVKNACENPVDPIFEEFWKHLQSGCQEAEIVLTSSGNWRKAASVHFLQQDEDQAVMPILEAAGIELVHPDLRSFQNLLISKDIGVLTLTFDALIDGFRSAGLTKEYPADQWPDFLRGKGAIERVWKLIDQILARRGTGKAFQEGESRTNAAKLALAVRRDGSLCPCSAVFAPVNAETIRMFHQFNKAIPFAAERSRNFASLSLLSPHFDAERAVVALEPIGHEAFVGVLTSKKVEPVSLISWFEGFKGSLQGDTGLSERLARLPIFPSGGSFKPLVGLSLPGDFEDPLRMADVLDVEVLPRFHDFLRDLGIQELSLPVFVGRHLIPALKGNDVTAKRRKAATLFLARKRSEVSEEEGIQESLAEVPLVECRDGEFRLPGECYFPEEGIVAVLGADVNVAQIPDEHEAIYRELLEWLGVADVPRNSDILGRINKLVESPPVPETVGVIQRVFEFLGQQFRLSGEVIPEGLDKLKDLSWLPADKDTQKWRLPNELHAGFQKYLFSSQADFLDVPLAVQQKSTEFLEFLEVATSPDTDLVVSHLLHCANTGVQVHQNVYRHLNEKSDETALGRLKGQACLLLPDGRYVKPEMVFWGNHSFGAYRWQLGSESQLRDYRKLFDRLGVKETPSWEDALSVLQEIGQVVGAAKEIIGDPLHEVVLACWQMLERALLSEEAEVGDLGVLQDVKTVPNLQMLLIEPNRMLFEDRAGLAAKFDGFLHQNTIPRPAGACAAMAAAGVRPLAAAVKVNLLECENPREDAEISDRVGNRSAILARVFDAQGALAEVHEQVEALENLRFERTELLQISYSISLFGRSVTSTPEKCPALFRPEENAILFMSSDGKMPWTSIAREISRAVDPDHEASASAAAIKEVISADSDNEASSILDELGFSTLVSHGSGGGSPGQTLEALGGITGGEGENEYDDEPPELPPKEDADQEGTPPDEEPQNEEGGAQSSSHPDDHPGGGGAGTSESHPGGGGSSGGGQSNTQAKRPPRRGRLRSYVLKDASPKEGDPNPKDSERQQFRLKVDRAGMDKVLEHERELGCIPEEQDHFNKGFDVISKDENGQVLRYIEVKSLSGSWGDDGIKLSPSQFEYGREKGDQFWIYVVERALDDDAVIHCIQNPIGRADEFLFDAGWQQAAEQDKRNLMPEEGY